MITLDGKYRFVEDYDKQLRFEIGQLVDYKTELPEQICKEPDLYDFYFNDFFRCYQNEFINDLNKIGQLLHQDEVHFFTPLYYYESEKKFFRTHLIQMDVPYAVFNIDITGEEYDEILLHKFRKGKDIGFTAFDYLYWYFNPDCFIYGDKTSEISILAIKKSLSLKNPLKNWRKVELFAANPGEEWGPWLKNEAKFLAELITNYHNN